MCQFNKCTTYHSVAPVVSVMVMRTLTWLRMRRYLPLWQLVYNVPWRSRGRSSVGDENLYSYTMTVGRRYQARPWMGDYHHSWARCCHRGTQCGQRWIFLRYKITGCLGNRGSYLQDSQVQRRGLLRRWLGGSYEFEGLLPSLPNDQPTSQVRAG